MIQWYIHAVPAGHRPIQYHVHLKPPDTICATNCGCDSNERRMKIPFGPQEMAAIIAGYFNHTFNNPGMGNGLWRKILTEYRAFFHKKRIPEDLRTKHRDWYKKCMPQGVLVQTLMRAYLQWILTNLASRLVLQAHIIPRKGKRHGNGSWKATSGQCLSLDKTGLRRTHIPFRSNRDKSPGREQPLIYRRFQTASSEPSAAGMNSTVSQFEGGPETLHGTKRGLRSSARVDMIDLSMKQPSESIKSHEEDKSTSVGMDVKEYEDDEDGGGDVSQQDVNKTNAEKYRDQAIVLVKVNDEEDLSVFDYNETLNRQQATASQGMAPSEAAVLTELDVDQVMLTFGNIACL